MASVPFADIGQPRAPVSVPSRLLVKLLRKPLMNPRRPVFHDPRDFVRYLAGQKANRAVPFRQPLSSYDR